MNIPDNLLYRDSHEWVRMEGKEAVIGITQYAQDQLGDVTYVELPAVGAQLAAGKEFGSIESVKAASDLYAPVSGSVIAVNEALASAPETVNQSPYEEGWMVRVSLSAEPAGLLSAADYAKCCEH
jgi:glycine cleavage system H protein